MGKYLISVFFSSLTADLICEQRIARNTDIIIILILFM